MNDYKEFSYIVEKQKIDEGYGVVITTDSPDRGGDIVVSEGIDYTEYMGSNPVVLFQHGRDPVIGSAPIAKSTKMKTFKHKIESNFIFAKDDYYADRIKNLWESGFLNTASIGIIPIETEELPPKGDDLFSQLFPPRKIVKSSLVEYSLVSIPMNPGAIRKELDEQLILLIQKIEEKIAPIEQILLKAEEIGQLVIKLQQEIEALKTVKMESEEKSEDTENIIEDDTIDYDKYFNEILESCNSITALV